MRFCIKDRTLNVELETMPAYEINITQQPSNSQLRLVIHTGYFDDPDDFPGLAHLYEHTLMRGSALAPGCHTVLANHHYTVAAVTDMQQITLTMECAHADVVTCSTLLEQTYLNYQPTLASIEAEINTICQEFSATCMDPIKRVQEVNKVTCNPLHPFAKFASGNIYTFAAHSPAGCQARLLALHQACISQPSRRSAPLPELYLPSHKGIEISVLTHATHCDN
ncbi:MAG: insulinase family protein [Glaciecola sp.]|jgi:secreted Zn-dependent insulinase-like peptidase